MGKQWGISVRGYYEEIVVGLGLILDDSGEEPRKCVLLWTEHFQKVG